MFVKQIVFVCSQEESAEVLVQSVTAIERKGSDSNATVCLKELTVKMI